MKMNIKLITTILTLGIVSLSATEVSAQWLHQKKVIGNYVGKSEGQRIKATVTVSRQSRTSFKKVDVEFNRDDWRTVTLSYDAKNVMYRGFISNSCDDPGCLFIALHEVKIYKDKDDKDQVLMSFNLFGFQNDEEAEEEPYGEDVEISGSLAKTGKK